MDGSLSDIVNGVIGFAAATTLIGVAVNKMVNLHIIRRYRSGRYVDDFAEIMGRVYEKNLPEIAIEEALREVSSGLIERENLPISGMCNPEVLEVYLIMHPEKREEWRNLLNAYKSAILTPPDRLIDI